MANNVRITELDFDTIKTNLKTYLRTRPEFTDYDFDASNLSVLLDLLAYNTHYNAVLSNMVANEMYLDTALKRSSVVSLAKHLNYTPRSRRSAQAVVNITLQNTTSQPNFLNLDPYTLFSTTVDGTAYTYYNIDSYSTTPVNGTYTFSNVKLYQGRKLDYFFTVGAFSSPADKYVIPNKDIDTSTLKVLVQYNGVGSYDESFYKVSDASEVTGTSKVYYLQENTEGYYEIFFGDGVLGQQLSQGDVIKISYLITEGDAGNVSTNVGITWSTNSIAGEGSGDRSITTISKPSGGSEKEDVDSIRFKSLNFYSAQNRAVTKTDYANIITDEIPGAESVIVWGGEDNDPPEYGKTFISIKPRTGYILTSEQKAKIIEGVLKPRAPIGAQHEFVDPTYTYIKFIITVRFASSRTNRSSNDISSLVNQQVNQFFSTNLIQFNAPFYRSQLEEQLMDLDNAILSVNVNISVQKRLPLIPNVRFSGTNILQLPIKIHPAELQSSYFYFTDATGTHIAAVRDVPDKSPPDYEGTGVLETYDLNTGVVLERPGTINYGTGKVVLDPNVQLTISGYPTGVNQIYFTAGAQESVSDIYPSFNEILALDDSVENTGANVQNGITINVIAVNN